MWIIHLKIQNKQLVGCNDGELLLSFMFPVNKSLCGGVVNEGAKNLFMTFFFTPCLREKRKPWLLFSHGPRLEMSLNSASNAVTFRFLLSFTFYLRGITQVRTFNALERSISGWPILDHFWLGASTEDYLVDVILTHLQSCWLCTTTSRCNLCWRIQNPRLFD